MKIKGLLLILEPTETMEEGVHQYAPCWSSCSAKESLQGLKAEGLDLAVDADKSLSTLPQEEAQDTYREALYPQPEKLQALLLEVGQGPWGGLWVLNQCQNMDKTSWFITSIFPQRERLWISSINL